MIPAIDPGFGLKEDRPAPRTPPSGDPAAFSRVLHRNTEPERDDSDRSVRDDRPTDDSRSREAYGRRHDDGAATHESGATQRHRESDGKATDQSRAKGSDQSPDKTDQANGKEPAGKAAQGGKPASVANAKGTGQAKNAQSGKELKPGKDAKQTDAAGALMAGLNLQSAAEQVANPALQAATTAQPVVAETIPQPGAAGLVQTHQTSVTHVPAIDDATPINAQIGLAAYKMGVHGEGETSSAEANGVVLPTNKAAKLAEVSAADAKQAAFQKTQVVAPTPSSGHGEATGLASIVKAAQGDGTTKPGVSNYKDQIALQTAQARNEVLSRLAATGTDGSGQAAGQGLGQGLAHGSADSLRQQLQLHGLLARDMRVHTLEPTSHAAPQTAAASFTTAPNSVPIPQPPTHDDTSAHHTIEKVATEARWLINNNRQEVTLRLSPDHLGNLHLKVQHEDGVFHIHLTVDNAAAKHLLESNLQDLRNQLSGEHPGGQFFFNVDVRQGHDQSGLYHRASRLPVAGVGHATGLEPAPAPALARRMIGHSGLSIYA